MATALRFAARSDVGLLRDGNEDSGYAGPRLLVVTEGPLSGTTVPLNESAVTLGRASDNTIVLADEYASGHHARLFGQDGEWYVEDLGSTNGTWVERARINGPTPVRPGIPVRVGQTVVELRK